MKSINDFVIEKLRLDKNININDYSEFYDAINKEIRNCIFNKFGDNDEIILNHLANKSAPHQIEDIIDYDLVNEFLKGKYKNIKRPEKYKTFNHKNLDLLKYVTDVASENAKVYLSIISLPF